MGLKPFVLGTLLILGTVCPAGAASAAPVAVSVIHLFAVSSVDAQCPAAGQAAIHFASTVTAIQADVSYAQWQGRHTVQDRFKSPDGYTYWEDAPVSASAPGSTCVTMRVAGRPASHLPGIWTYEVLIDGQPLAVQKFVLGAAVLAVATRAAVAVQGIRFYADSDYKLSSCEAQGPAASAFSTSVRGIAADVLYAGWQGRHTLRGRWYTPNGKLYFQDPAVTFPHARHTCDNILISGYRGQYQPGVWTYRVVVDGTTIASQSFTLSAGPASQGLIAVKSIRLYTGGNFHYSTCTPTGPAASTFSTGTTVIEADVRYSTWQGSHTVQDRWYAPDGSLYVQDSPTTYPRSPHATCEGIYIAHQRAARLLGNWTYQVVVDGQAVGVKSFALTSP